MTWQVHYDGTGPHHMHHIARTLTVVIAAVVPAIFLIGFAGSARESTFTPSTYFIYLPTTYIPTYVPVLVT